MLCKHGLKNIFGRNKINKLLIKDKTAGMSMNTAQIDARPYSNEDIVAL